MSKEIDEFVRDLCSVDFRAKSITRIRVRKFVSEYKAKIIQIGEGMKAGEIGASEGNRTVELSENIWARLEGSHNPTWIAAEIHNLALSNYKNKIKKA